MKNTLKKVTASVVTLMFAIGLSLVAATPASAEGVTNSESYWKTPGTSEICTKVAPGGTTWSLSSVTLPAGSSWTKVIVKAGSTGTSVDNENTAYYTNATYKYPGAEPTASWTHVADLASTVFKPASDKDISHVIYCSAPNPTTPLISATPVAPTFTDAVCTAAGGSSTPSYTIFSTRGVKYQQSSDGTTFTNVASGSYMAVVGSKIWVKPVALSGYVLTSSALFRHTFTPAYECGPGTPLISATPVAPTFTDAVCTAAGGSSTPSYTIFSTRGVKYQQSSDGTTFTNVASGSYMAVVGSKIWVKPVALSGYVLSSSSTFGPHTFTSAGDCLVTAIPADPTFLDAMCMEEGGNSPASYSIPDATGIQYQVSINNNAFEDVSAGSHGAVVGSTIVVKPVALSGYVLSSSSTFGPHTFSSDSECPVTVTPASPTYLDAMCMEEGGNSPASYTIPTTTGVQYRVSVNGSSFVDVSADSHPAAVGSTIVVKPVALAGYVLAASSTFGPHTFNVAEDCFQPPTLGLVTPTASSSPITCDRAGSYTLGNVEGVIWLVDGMEKRSGTYDVSTASTVNVVATVDPAKNGFEQGAQTEWTFRFTSPADCGDLPTFALVTPFASHLNRTCTGSGSYTLAAVEGIIYTVNGSVQKAGTYPVSTAKTVDVIATTASAEFGLEAGVQSSWNFIFSDPDNCGELTTLALPGSKGILAFTGSNGTLAGGLMLGLLFMMLGAGAITVNHVRRRTN